MRAWLTDRGFDPAVLRFALRTALACCLAIYVAWALGLEHPQWSGMSVWAASQPLRGQLIEKSFFRFAGTLGGSVVGVLLVLAMQVHPLLLVLGLSGWIGACTWLGNMQRGLVGYGTVLAGYTASMVALLDTGHPDQVLLLGADRLATVLTGVVIATLVGYFFARRTDRADLRGGTCRLLADVLRQFAVAAAGGRRAEDVGGVPFLQQLAALEESLEPHGAGSLRSRLEARAIRRILLATVPMLLPHGRDALDRAAAMEAAAALDEDAPERAAGILGRAENAELRDLAAALQGWQASEGSSYVKTLLPFPSGILHRDWIGAREAALRAAGAMLLFGMLWQVSGWHEGPFMLLGLSVMISLFSTFDNPAATMRLVILGQALAIVAALLCRWAIWPVAESEWQLIALMIPFILIGAVLVGHTRTFFCGLDYSMVFLLLSLPALPLGGTFGGSIERSTAVISAPLIAWLGYLFVFPVDLARRQRHLVEMMLRDIAAIAASPDPLGRRSVWQARAYHRALRLVRISERLARAETRADEASHASLVLTHALMRLHELANDGQAARRIRKCATLGLARATRLRSRPAKAAAAFGRMEAKLTADDAALMNEAAAAVRLLLRIDGATPPQIDRTLT